MHGDNFQTLSKLRMSGITFTYSSFHPVPSPCLMPFLRLPPFPLKLSRPDPPPVVEPCLGWVISETLRFWSQPRLVRLSSRFPPKLHVSPGCFASQFCWKRWASVADGDMVLSSGVNSPLANVRRLGLTPLVVVSRIGSFSLPG